ncbi:MAG: class I SAM-dependent methyltransferase [Candidatus Hydrogenedentes bacterium]|nr:class I SAM-dependent methyltransferase [Candidatus Hydrogenedentota bacterium]
MRRRLSERIRLALKHMMVKAQYEYLNKLDKEDKQIRLLNYGYEPISPDAPRLELLPEEESNRYAIQLYHYVAGAVDLAGKDVLEVGCGRGGGAAFVMRHFRPRIMVGVDLWRSSVNFCNDAYDMEGLSFRRGNAESLPFPEDRFDVVLNIESSHLYDHIEAFYAEVLRVLRPGGHLLFADFRTKDRVPQLTKEFEEAGFEVVRNDTINENVLAALDLDDERKRKLIVERLPQRRQEQFSVFAALKGTHIYECIKSGDIEYKRYVLRKPA